MVYHEVWSFDLLERSSGSGVKKDSIYGEQDEKLTPVKGLWQKSRGEMTMGELTSWK